MGRSHLLRSFALLAAAAFLATACVQQAGPPSDCASAQVERSVTLEGDAFSPDHIDVCKGQALTLKVSVKQDGELHFHGYDDLLAETEVTAGEERQFTFDTLHAGQFPIELHPPTGDEVQVGILTVYEP